MTLACGTCGISSLSIGLPWLGEWVGLSILTLIFYNWANRHENRPGRSWLDQAALIVLGVALGGVVLAGLLIPLWFLISLGILFSRLRSSSRLVRSTSLVLLGLFALCAAVRSFQVRGMAYPDYLLTRFLAGGPGIHHLNRLAKAEPFALEHYAQLVLNGSPRQCGNASKLLERRAGHLGARTDDRAKALLVNERDRLARLLVNPPASAQEACQLVRQSYAIKP